MNIVLCGMPGAGKTSVGEKLAVLSGRTCLDTDGEIVKKYGPISDIFEERGEGYFRDLETKEAETLSDRDGLVITTGGGFVLRDENVAYLKKNGKIFYLRAKKETLVSRVAGNSDRPLLAGDAQKRIEELMQKRSARYETVADYTVDTDQRGVAEIAEEILRLAEGRQ